MIGSNPGWLKGYVPTSDEWNALIASKLDVASVGTAGTLIPLLDGANTASGAWSFTAAGTALAVTNNATVGGTLGVTGVLTAPQVTSATNLTLGAGAALATSATTGMILIPTCAGAPTGNVGALGKAAFIWDSTDAKLYVGVGGTWKSVVLA